jgi:glucose-6-phosphate isomerase
MRTSSESEHHTSLSIDTRNMRQEHVGAQGVAPQDLMRISNVLASAHRTLSAKSEGGLEAEFACLNLAHAMQGSLQAIQQAAGELRHFQDIVLIGIGGSSLGTKAIRHALKPEHDLPAGGPRLYFVENIDPYHMDHLLSQLDPTTTALLCISKSGGTIETVVQFLILRKWLKKSLGEEKARRHQWLITDPDQGWLRQLSTEQDIASLPVPPQVGGRYSVLTAVGLLPLAVVGVDISELLLGAADTVARCRGDHIEKNPALEMAALYYLLDVTYNKRISVMMPYVNRLRLFVDWYCQLWAESLGKWDTKRPEMPAAGTLPVRAMGAVDQHSQLQMYLESRHDKMFTFIELAHWDHDLKIPVEVSEREFFPYLEGKSLVDVIHAEFVATRQVITDTGHPNMTLHLPTLNAYTLGQLIELYQRTTVYTGLLYGINPLDQPSVEKGKILAIQHLKAMKR